MIDRAGVPLRVAVLPQVDADESGGDPRAIALAIVRRVPDAGLLVLVDQHSRMTYAAEDLPLDVTAFSLPAGRGPEDEDLPERLRALVRIVRAAPSAPPVSFLPYARSRVPSSSGADEPLVLIALVCGVLGAVIGLGLHYLMRAAVVVAAAVSGARRAHDGG